MEGFNWPMIQSLAQQLPISTNQCPQEIGLGEDGGIILVIEFKPTCIITTLERCILRLIKLINMFYQ